MQVFFRVTSSDPKNWEFVGRQARWFNSTPSLSAGCDWTVLGNEEQAPSSDCLHNTIKVVVGGPAELLSVYQSSQPGQVILVFEEPEGSFAGVEMPREERVNIFVHNDGLANHYATIGWIIEALDRNREIIDAVALGGTPLADEIIDTGHGLSILVVEDCGRGRGLSSGLSPFSDYSPQRLIGCLDGRKGHNLTVVNSLSGLMRALSMTSEYDYDLILAPMCLSYDGWEFVGGDGEPVIDLRSVISQLGMVLPFGGMIEQEGISRAIPVGLISYKWQRGLNKVWSYPGSSYKTNMDGWEVFVCHHEQPGHIKVGTRWDLFLAWVLSEGPQKLRAKAGL